LWNYLLGAGEARAICLNKQKSSLIIFIDGGCDRQVPQQRCGGNDEREQTLNQLLTEMDGFAVSDATVIVLAVLTRKFGCSAITSWAF